ncbi:S41 family peptidase [Massilia sp. DD77]|uniref:S41 family peptidase n=1 Tax=Massilia sp. DD77 TaxID=3109349 RepID=UPI002FFF49E9
MAHKRARKRLAVLVLASVLRLPAQAAQAPAADLIPTSLAKEVVGRTIELVETNALPPRDPAEYAQAKTALLAVLSAAGEHSDRRALFQHVDTLLGTLDADRHSFIRSPVAMQGQQAARVTALAAAAPVSSFALLDTGGGKVLHWTPPQSVGNMEVEAPAFLKRFMADASALPGLSSACALVVDLSAQRGGNAWPPFAAMHPLLSAANTASMVDRNGVRQRYVHPQTLAQIEQRHGGEGKNPLLRFAGTPLGVVVGGQTSSAGEMLLVALMGEGERVRTFGTVSHGMTTANMSYPMADGSTLILSERRYAVGDAPVIRGGIPAQVSAAAGAAAVRQAAEWAASRSPLCRAPRQASAAP